MAREVQEPTVVREGGPLEGDVYTHPAYAQIGASRVSGGAVLYGSDFLHQNYIRVRIAPSELKRSLANDWFHGSNRPYIEIDLSEAQWATFVSSMNVGNGVPCTLAYRDGESIPGLPRPVDRTEQFSGEVRERMDKAISELDRLREMIGASGLSQKKQAELLGAVEKAATNMGSNVRYVAEQFDEHMERTIEGAKTEVNAYVMNGVMRAGLAALGQPAPLELGYSNGGRDEQRTVEAAP